MWLWLVVGPVLGFLVVRQGWRFVELVAARRAKRRMARLCELVTAWQAANGDEVAILNRRVTEAQMSMAAAEQSARVSAVHLASIEHTWARQLETVEQRRELELLVAQGRISLAHLEI